MASRIRASPPVASQAQPCPELRRSGRSPISSAEMLQQQRCGIARGQSLLDRLSISLFRAGEEAGPEQITRIVIKNDPSQIEIGRDERDADARALEQSRIPPIPAVACVGNEAAL